MRAGRGGTICGKVNAKNRYGAYVGFKDFVVDKDGWPEISEHNNGVGSELFTSFAAAYLAGCATKEEQLAFAAATTPSYSSDEGYAPPATDAAEAMDTSDINSSEDPFAE